ncbi:MAG TPA: PadR family transcriptional regulator [Thermoanaerobaculia bacterium]|nr:PadR family transcriptional regulator [Thermoanaerobaculia bacterium]
MRQSDAATCTDNQLLKGTLDLLILQALAGSPRHGYAIAEWIESATSDAFQIAEGTIYPALHRLEGRGCIEAEWGVSENNRRAKFYRLTRAGRRRLVAERRRWDDYAAAMERALASAGGRST